MIAIICGSGEYPFEIAKNLRDANIEFVLIFLNSFYNKNLQWPDVKNIKVSLGEVSKFLAFCKEENVTKIIMAGGVQRPNMSDLALDGDGKKWLKKIGKKIFFGDDGLLRAISDLFKEYGISVISGKEFLKDKKVIRTNRQPDEVDMADIMKGMSILNTLSAYDVGQSVVIENGLVLGIECVEGTDSLIKRVKDIKKTSNRGVLVKTAKITQDMRVDIPTVGIDTIKNAYLAGLSGLAVGKDKCIILNKDEIECFANEHNMFFCEISCE